MHLNKMVHQDSKLNNMQIYFPDNKSLHAKIYDKLYGTMQYALTALGKVIFEKSAVSNICSRTELLGVGEEIILSLSKC
jgi:hypothetical protein